MKKIVLALTALLLVGSVTALTAQPLPKADREALKRGIEQYGCIVQNAIDEFGVPVAPSYIMAQMGVESTFVPTARNKVSGATGLLQVKPETATDVRRWYPNTYFGKDLTDPKTNIRIAIAYRDWIQYESYLGTYHNDAADVSVAFAVGHNKAPKILSQLRKQGRNAWDHGYNRAIKKWLPHIEGLVCNSQLARR